MLIIEKFLKTYEPELHHTGFSVFSGGAKTEGKIYCNELPDTPIIQAFLDDDDLQEMTITSGNIGFSRTWTKEYKRSPRMQEQA